MQFPLLETERLNLVEVDQRYTDSFFQIMSNPTVTKYYGMDSLENQQQAKNIIHSFKRTYESNRGIRWGIVLKESGELIGTLGLNNLNKHSKRAEIGYELNPAFWGRGMTSEAVREVLKYSFEELDLFRMGAVTFPENIASINLLKKHGFIKEGRLRGYLYQGQQSHDAILFSLLKTEWQR
ncbi:GNAT family N-acetyltransferase [Oceanobacillus polygoni]|uniref:Ribosomal-protein-alanine N-acetyltransferase n=1 Tax=Oceanobacillus polygoni TaxID=1235259 RepID=A0A9X1CAL9_9BACI|nr:GNAT family protein [Oceanobacillus polygoni]MBP2076809.1 ribosomal-protein-alanine N-acetyltransferase [Oceanobacillus polygoni]